MIRPSKLSNVIRNPLFAMGYQNGPNQLAHSYSLNNYFVVHCLDNMIHIVSFLQYQYS